MTATIDTRTRTATTPRAPSDTGTGTGTGTGTDDPTSRLMRAAALLGPLFFLASSAVWLGGDDFEEARGILMFWAMPFTALAVYGIAERLRRLAPRGRAAVTALITIGACAGAGFATEVSMVEHFGVERLMDQDTPSAFLGLGIPGPMFAVALVVLGVLSFRLRTLPRPQALLLAVGGVLFPLGRIPQVPGLALATDVLLLAALAPVAFTPRRRSSLAD